MVLSWVTALASVLGFFLALAAVLRIRREHYLDAGQRGRGGFAGNLLLLSGACLLAACGQYLTALLARAPDLGDEQLAAREAARARLAFLYRTPLTRLHLRCGETDPFAGFDSVAAVLRLTFADSAGAQFVSVLTLADLRRTEQTGPDPVEYAVPWKTVARKATRHRGPPLVERVLVVSDLTQLCDLHVELAIGPQAAAPAALWLAHLENETVELFDGTLAAQQRTGSRWILYHDEQRLMERLKATSNAAPNPSANWLDLPALGIALGTLLILTGLGLRSQRANTTGWLPVGVLGGIIVGIYYWLITAGTLTNWVPNYGYHNLLADAFLNGQLHLLTLPEPELLTQPDPYAYAAETGKYATDFSLFDGKYYFYWGPFPALLMAGMRQVFGLAEVPDSWLVLLFASGCLLFGTLLLREVWRRWYAGLPWATVLPAVLVLGLMTPLPGLLSVGTFYEHPTLGGQMFLLGGLYWALSAFSPTGPSCGRLLLAGIFWALAPATRVPLAVVVAVLGLAVAWQVVRAGKGMPALRTTVALACLGVPLLLSAGAMGLYNYLRFGSPLEMGNRYVLTVGMKTLEMYQEGKFFNLRSAVPNLASYLFYPPDGLEIFPYLVTRQVPLPAWLPVPEWYLEIAPRMPQPKWYFKPFPVVGLAFGGPFLAFAFVALFSARRRSGTAPEPAAAGTPGLGWLVALLFAAAGLGIFPSLLVPAAAQRYLLDATPALVILAAVGVWHGAALLSHRPAMRAAWLACAGFVAVATALSGVLLAIFWEGSQFLLANPCLVETLTQILPRGNAVATLGLLTLVLLCPLLPFLIHDKRGSDVRS